MKLYRILFLVTIVLSFAACKNDNDQPSGNENEESTTQTVAVPSFNRDSAYAFVEKQVAFGTRTPGSEGHAAAKAWLSNKFESYGLNVIQQDFQATRYDGVAVNGTNIIAQFKPEISKRVLLAAHWDTRHIADSPLSEERKNEPILGADDGGSGTAILLEIARLLQENPLDIGVDLILFDAEDLGESGSEDPKSTTTWCLGSQHWGRNVHVGNYNPKYGILLDMVGSKGAKFPIEGYSAQIAPQLVDKVWTLAQNMGYTNYFERRNAGAITDDHYFVSTLTGIPMIDIINRSTETETGFGAHWHTQNDDMDIIDKRTLKAVGQVVTAVIYRENNGTL